MVDAIRNNIPKSDFQLIKRALEKTDKKCYVGLMKKGTRVLNRIPNRPFIHVVFIILVGFAAYSNTLQAPFIFDDYPFIFKNLGIRNLSNFSDCSGSRYLTFLSFALNYYIDGYRVIGYHIVNIALHLSNAILMYLLIRIIFKAPVFKDSPFTRYSGILAIASGLLFAGHPVYTQAVTYTAQRSTLLEVFFYLSSLLSFLKARLNYGSFFSRGHRPYYLISVISAVLAMKCKEISFTLPFIIILSDRYFFGNRWKFKKSIVYLIPILLTLSVIPLSEPQADAFRRQTGGVFKLEDGMIASGHVLDKFSQFSTIPRKEYLFTQFRVILTYIRLFFFPVNLSLAYDYPIYSSFLNPEVWLSFVLLLSMFGLAAYLFLRARKRPNSGGLLFSFGIFWFFICLSIESFVVVVNCVIFEYRLYLPSIGLFFSLLGIMGYALHHFDKNKFKHLLTVTLCIVIAFSCAAYARNGVFGNEITLWKDAAEKAPFNVQAHLSLGIYYSKQRRMDEAIEEYKTVIRINPDYAKAHNNLGIAYESKGLITEAIHEYRTALILRPDLSEAYGNLGFIYFYRMGRADKAVEQYRLALKFNPNNASTHLNIAIAYKSLGLIDQSRRHFKIARRMNPSLFK